MAPEIPLEGARRAEFVFEGLVSEELRRLDQPKAGDQQSDAA